MALAHKAATVGRAGCCVRVIERAGRDHRSRLCDKPPPDRITGRADRAPAAQLAPRLVERRADQRGAAGQPAGGLAGYRVLLEQHQRHIAPDGRPSHRHAGVAAQADHEVNLFLL